MFINITNIKLEGKEELFEVQTQVNLDAPFTESVLNNPAKYPIAAEYRALVLQELERRYNAKVESCDIEFTDIDPKFAQLAQAWKEAQSGKKSKKEYKLLKALFCEESYKKLPDTFKHLPFTTDMYSNPIASDAMDSAYRHLLGITMGLLTYCTIDFAELSDEEYQRHMEGCVRPTVIRGICDSMFAPYLQWKKLPKDASTFKFVQNRLGKLAAEVLRHPSNHQRVARLMLVILYTRALSEPQSKFLDTYWMDDEAQAHNYLYHSAITHVLDQYLADMLMGSIFVYLNTTTESTMPSIYELPELYTTSAHRVAMSLNIKAHKLAVQTATNVTDAMQKEHLTTEATHVSARVIEMDTEAKYRTVEVRYRNTDTIAENCENKVDGPPYIYTVHTQEYNEERECWETTTTQPFAMSDGDASTVFSGEYGRCMLLTDERLETVLDATEVDDGLTPAATNDLEDYKGTYIWPFPRAFKKLVACSGKNVLSLLKEYGNTIFHLYSDDSEVELN